MMPGHAPTLNDEEIAAVLTHLRHEWGSGASPVDPTSVKIIREKEANRTAPWTLQELEQLPPAPANVTAN